ncbi:MAG: hypothetical protein JOZ39_08580, partial [Chloroflexi bacterium]|nr:hypothetical protein [Chloroflexota bacterium]
MAGSAGAVQLVTALAGLLVARGMEPVEYGRVAYFMSAFGIAVLLGAMGLTTQVTTDVARLAGHGELDRAGEALVPLIIARLLTLTPLAVIGLALTLAGNAIAGAAVGSAIIALLAGFFLGIVQGVGRARLVVGIQLGQSCGYLLAIALWGRFSPEGVFLTLATSYAASLLTAALAAGLVIPNWTCPRGAFARQWRGFARFSSQAYAVSLLLAPYASLAVLALGQAGKFADAAAFGVALPLVLLVPTALGMVVMVQYHPRLCAVIGRAPDEAQEWFDVFYRAFAVVGIASFVIV